MAKKAATATKKKVAKKKTVAKKTATKKVAKKAVTKKKTSASTKEASPDNGARLAEAITPSEQAPAAPVTAASAPPANNDVRAACQRAWKIFMPR